MKKYIIHKKDIPFKNQLMISYSVILTIILIIGVMLYYISSSQVKNGINEQNRLTLSSSVAQIDNTMELMSAAVKQTASNRLLNNLSKLSGEEGPDFYYLGYKTQLSLKAIAPVEFLLPTNNSFIFLEKSNYVVSSTIFSHFGFFIENNSKYPIEADAFSKILLNEHSWNKFISLEQLSASSKNYVYIYPLSISGVSKASDSILICYLFDYDRIREYFSGIKLYEDGYLTAYNKNGSQMFLMSNGAKAADYNTLNSLDYKKQISRFNSKKKHEEMLVTTYSSPYNDWTYYLVQPEDKAYYSITPYQRFFTAVTVIALGIAGVLSILFSSFGSRYLTQLYNELTAKESVASSLNLLVEKQKPMVIESYMRRIMEGSVTTKDEMLYIMKELSLERPDVKYHVLYTEVTPSEDSNIHSYDMELCIQNYDMLVREALIRYYPDTGYIYNPTDRVFAILIAAPGEDSFTKSVMEQNINSFVAMHKELLENYGIWISGGLGGRNGMISNTWKSYQQAKETKSITTTEKYILSHDFTSSSDVYYYPESLSVQLSGFISSGSKEQVAELFKLIKNENTKKRNLSYNQQSWLVSDVRSTLFKKRHNMIVEGLSEEKSRLLDVIDKQFEGEISLNSLKTIATELCEVCGSEGNDLILKIQDYINKNYHDPDLGLTKISDEFGISENYFSYLFKKEVSENFSTYLERLRMAKAKEIILETNTSLSTLYQYLGYNNAASFRRAFKKIFGVSPKEMRDKINA